MTWIQEKEKSGKIVSLLRKMLATVKSMHSPTKEHSCVFYLMSLEEAVNKLIV